MLNCRLPSAFAASFLHQFYMEKLGRCRALPVKLMPCFGLHATVSVTLTELQLLMTFLSSGGPDHVVHGAIMVPALLACCLHPEEGAGSVSRFQSEVKMSSHGNTTKPIYVLWCMGQTAN